MAFVVLAGLVCKFHSQTTAALYLVETHLVAQVVVHNFEWVLEVSLNPLVCMTDHSKLAEQNPCSREMVLFNK